MVCKAYQRRRRLLAAGHAKGGVIGAVKTVPAILRDVRRGEADHGSAVPIYRQPVVRETKPGGAGQ
ncbi:hypothetical protein [Aurantimonas sp. 22II-16-19i]|uniref:hypothetical protein n=1 Tax=Aurantimonas sp. 22II-16-19i TaxID=1317114 RepID=UPI0009F7F29F|nr:hypothetical protein [Aurantimonas sp. 22II-16-19i]ORE87725.1 hypothetical protein ATO4_25263 [Aurantimonas sp. 22II-16-19i]